MEIHKSKIKVDEEKSELLGKCLYCGETIEFGERLKTHGYIVRHHPTGGCPARSEQYCDDFEAAQRLWQGANERNIET